MHKRGKQNFTPDILGWSYMLTNCSHFSGQGSYYSYTHAWTKLQSRVMSWIIWHWVRWPLPEANSTIVRNLYRLWGACPCLSWSAVAMHVLTWVVSAPGFLVRYLALIVAGSSWYSTFIDSSWHLVVGKIPIILQYVITFPGRNLFLNPLVFG